MRYALALRNVLLEDAVLAGFFSGRVTWGYQADESTYPQLVLQQITAAIRTSDSMTHSLNVEDVTVQLDLLARDADQVAEIDSALKQLLDSLDVTRDNADIVDAEFSGPDVSFEERRTETQYPHTRAVYTLDLIHRWHDG